MSHNPSFFRGGLTRYAWRVACSCGWNGEAHGYTSEDYCRQEAERLFIRHLNTPERRGRHEAFGSTP